MLRYFPKMIHIYSPMIITYISLQVYSRKVHFIYRLANPLFPPGVVENVDITFDTLPSGDLNATLLLTSDGECQVGILPFEAIPGEKFRAVYTTDEPFFTTGTPFTISLFSCKPEDYAFMFVCHDRSKEIVRNGRRVYCDGPHEILFGVYEYPPDRVKWCNAERDLWINYRLSFDNAFMKFIRTRAPCPVST